MLAEPFIKRFYPIIQETRSSWLTEVLDVSRLGLRALDLADHAAYHAQFEDSRTKQILNTSEETYGFSHPHCVLLYPVYEELANRFSPLVGLLQGIFPWDHFVQGLIP